MICSRRLYKGNSYEICLPLTDSGVTLARFYTAGDVIIEKVPEITGDSMCFSFTEEEIASLPDGVLRYELVTEYETTDTNSPYVVVTPGDYSGSTLDDLLEDAFESGLTACSGESCDDFYESGYTSGYTDGYDSGYTAGQEDCSGSSCDDFYESGYTSGYTDGEDAQKAKLEYVYIQKDDLTYIPMNMAYAGLFSKEDGYNMVQIYLDVSDLIESGMSAQRDLLVDSAFTENGLWWRRDGYRQVRVNVPQTGHTDQEMQDSWNSGYTSGHTDGFQDGYASGSTDCSGTGVEDLIANLQGDYFVIPEGTTSIRDYALYKTCFSSITIPNTVTSIGDLSFAHNYCLEEIEIPDSVTSVGESAFVNCSGLTSVTIGSGLTYLQNYMFQSCKSLPTLEIPLTVTGLGAGVFNSCYALSSITIPSSVTSIGDTCFSNCSGLTDITIPSSVSRIGRYCFNYCTSLTAMTFEGTTPPTLGSSANSLGSSAYTFPIYVPCESVEDYKTAFGEYYAPRVQANPDCSGTPIDYRTEYLTFDIISGGSITWRLSGDSVPKTIEYKVNDGEWSSITATYAGVSFNVNSGDTVQLRGTNTQYGNSGIGNQSAYTNNFVGSTAVFNIKGNIMSLINKDNFSGRTSLSGSWNFWYMFNGTNVVDASNLLLPATSITEACYEYMFADCTMMHSGPKVLPGTVIISNSYFGMFMGCTSLVEAPEMLATSINSANNLAALTLMFKGCTSLTKAPDILVNKLYYRCADDMFRDCPNISYIKCLATTIQQGSCSNWLTGTAEYGTFVKHPNASGWVSSRNGIPAEWTVVDADIS